MRVSTVVLALLCLVTGYALAGTRVKADESPSRRFPSGVGVGTPVVLSFSSDPKSANCKIAGIDSGWVRCAPVGDSVVGQTPEVWYDITQVVGFTKLEARR